MRLLFHVDKYDDDKLIGLCVKIQVNQYNILHESALEVLYVSVSTNMLSHKCCTFKKST